MPKLRPAPLVHLAVVTALAALLALVPGVAALAQQGGPFAARVYVNDRAITNYEFDQRVRMLTLFRAPGDIQAQALQDLIDDRLRLDAARALGLEATPEAIRAGMEEFASRAQLSAEQFVEALGQGGVSEETFRDFVEAGILWRETVRQRWTGRVFISEAEIDRAIARSNTAVETRVLLSEIVIAAPTGNDSEAFALASRLRSGLRGEPAFAKAAQDNSAARTAADGGKLDWLALDALPPEVAAAVKDLRPGAISVPVRVPGGVAIYFLRGLDSQPIEGQTAAQVVEYARLILRPDRPAAEEAARIGAEVDTCDDLYGFAIGQPEEVLVFASNPVGQIPGDLSGELARLDPGETTLISRGGAAQLLMLCRRGPDSSAALARDLVQNDLQNRRLAALAEIYLEELRQMAIIREP